jgi:hypothetical protein
MRKRQLARIALLKVASRVIADHRRSRYQVVHTSENNDSELVVEGRATTARCVADGEGGCELLGFGRQGQYRNRQLHIPYNLAYKILVKVRASDFRGILDWSYTEGGLMAKMYYIPTQTRQTRHSMWAPTNKLSVFDVFYSLPPTSPYKYSIFS